MTGPDTRVAVGASGVSLSRVVWGTVSLSGFFGQVRDGAADDVLRACDDLGVTTIDTAPRYGDGAAETLIGEALRGRSRSRYELCSKVGWTLTDDGPVPAFDAASVRRGLEDSLDRLGVSYLDVVFVHDPEGHERECAAGAWEALQQARQEGLVRALGVGTTDADCAARLTGALRPDVVMIASRCHLMDQSAAQHAIPAARASGATVIAAAVFASGLLSDPGRDSVTYEHRPATEAEVSRARALERTCEDAGVSLRTAALQFAWTVPGVDAVAVGTGSGDRLRSAAADLAAEVPADLFARLGVR